MADLSGFNAAEIEPAVGFEPVPAGKYAAVITDSEFKPNKAGTGEYLQLSFQITAGEYQNRLLWARLNLKNPSSVAVQIAKGELAAICHAVDVLQPNDSADLHNLPLTVHVRCKKRDDTGEITNEIKGYSKRAVPPPPQATTANSTPPWKRT